MSAATHAHHYRYRQHLLLMRMSLLTAFGLIISACSTVMPTTQAPKMPIVALPSVALVLGGGGNKGFAHVGVIQALEERYHANPRRCTSVGSLVGSLYASGYTPTQLERLALTTTDSELTDFVLSNQDLLKASNSKTSLMPK